MPNLSPIESLFNTNPISGNFCQLHHVTLDDAPLIYDLRTNRKNNFLKETKGDVSDQRSYLESYFKRFAAKEEIYYKIFDLKTHTFVGVLRLTHINHPTLFNWESFVVFENTSPNVPLDAMLMIYTIGFQHLNRQSCGTWQMKKDFLKLKRLHEMMQMAKIIDENEEYYVYSVQKTDYDNNITKFLKMGYGCVQGIA